MALALAYRENSNPEELTSARGDIVKRAFWHCSVMETLVDPNPTTYAEGTHKL